MINLKVKSKTGHMMDIQVTELLEVDGRPYSGIDQHTDCAERFAYLQGQLDVLRSALVQPVVATSDDNCSVAT